MVVEPMLLFETLLSPRPGAAGQIRLEWTGGRGELGCSRWYAAEEPCRKFPLGYFRHTWRDAVRRPGRVPPRRSRTWRVFVQARCRLADKSDGAVLFGLRLFPKEEHRVGAGTNGPKSTLTMSPTVEDGVGSIKRIVCSVILDKRSEVW
jgi:hypothetical protein